MIVLHKILKTDTTPTLSIGRLNTIMNQNCICVLSKELGFSCLKKIFSIVGHKNLYVLNYDDISDKRSCFYSIEKYCKNNQIKNFKIATTSDLETYVREISPNIVFVSGWYGILPESLLNIPKLGFIGIHFSLLPQYRGFAPVVWGIINGEKKAGFSLFKFDNGIDSGMLYDQGCVEINEDDYIGDVFKKLENIALKSLEEKFPRIITGKQKLVAQCGVPTFCARRFEKDGKINWNLSQEQIYNFIRAQSHPYPGAFTIIGNTKIYIYRCKKLPETYYATPGQIIAYKEKIIIATGDSRAIQLLDFTVDGDKNLINSLHSRCS